MTKVDMAEKVDENVVAVRLNYALARCLFSSVVINLVSRLAHKYVAAPRSPTLLTCKIFQARHILTSLLSTACTSRTDCTLQCTIRDVPRVKTAELLLHCHSSVEVIVHAVIVSPTTTREALNTEHNKPCLPIDGRDKRGSHMVLIFLFMARVEQREPALSCFYSHSEKHILFVRFLRRSFDIRFFSVCCLSFSAYGYPKHLTEEALGLDNHGECVVCCYVSC